MDEVSAQSLEIGERYMTEANRKLDALDGEETSAVASNEGTAQDSGAAPT
jgi:hypothetical protein